MDNRIRGNPDKQRILIVDDDRNVVKLLQKTFTGSKVESDYASDGFEAGLKIMKFRPHIIILDLIMPKMNGRETFVEMRKIDAHCNVLIASGFTKNESFAELRNAGLVGFIHKPYRDYELSQLLAKVLL